MPKPSAGVRAVPISNLFYVKHTTTKSKYIKKVSIATKLRHKKTVTQTYVTYYACETIFKTTHILSGNRQIFEEKRKERIVKMCINK